MLARLALLAAAVLPLAHAAALYAAKLPRSLQSSVASGSCRLPDDFELQGLGGLSANGTAFETLDFVFYDNSTLITTQCHLNASSVPVEVGGRTPRYKCDGDDVFFIFQDAKLTMIEALCPGADGVNDYEASGSAYPVVPDCDGATGSWPRACPLEGGATVSNKFTSFNIVPPTAA